jgi:hypothetical protein
MAEPPKLRMTLLDNAYDFVNYSLELSEDAENRDPAAWKPAILNIVQGIELLVKERLYREHRLLIFDNVDKPRNTVSLQQALERLQAVGVVLDSDDRRAIERAKAWRDLMMHYEFDLFVHEVKQVYALLFEFAHSFHERELGGELHDHIREDLWLREAALMEFFREQFVVYRGYPMVARWPARLLRAQFLTTLGIEGERYRRIPYGSESYGSELPEDHADSPCHDCAVVKGELHVPTCDMEECPRCLEQLFSCTCEITDPEWPEEEDEEENGLPRFASEGDERSTEKSLGEGKTGNGNGQSGTVGG